MQIQDSETPEPCCGPVRPMLAVARPERRRLLLHPAPAPGGRAPAWINVAACPSPCGQLPVPGIDDLAGLVLRRCYERLEARRAGCFVQDAVAVMRLAWQIERDEAIPARDKALAELAEVQAAVLSLKDRDHPPLRAGRMAGAVERGPEGAGEGAGDPEGEGAFRYGGPGGSSAPRPLGEDLSALSVSGTSFVSFLQPE